ncbi:T9SS type A sorting domain-containing protein [Ferruginibacter albus]|uniref:T9SS type A sorting domain-containing protein n=1 Tax=Ferruginibacter albus TaxID=2875540 RepID=UPI001CC444ED|nr:T9SS type A sorting domain-containing protein [Ferruginibacter albus]UAY51023.1 T9SS type A sorting domain-containing protein [Ferruginibacter albus]
MKKLFTLACLTLYAGLHVIAQCPNNIRVQNITLPTCGSSNGKFDVLIENHGSSTIQVSINGGANFTSTTGSSITFNNLTSNLYNIIVRQSGSSTNCQTLKFILRSDYGSGYTATATNATGCNATGSIKIGGGVLSTDSVAWLSNVKPNFVTAGSLTNNTISNLIPGQYYVVFKSASGGQYCYSTHSVTIGNSGTACPAPTFCGNATDPSNLYPNGTFGSGGNADGTNAQINGPALADGITQYTYQPLGINAPQDGCYAIANNTFAGSDIGTTPFNGGWYDGYDHDYVVTGQKNGYQMVVNASFDPDIVLQQTVTDLCPDKKYQFSAYIRNLKTDPTSIPANLSFLINGVGLYSTGDIAGGNRDWRQIGFTFQPTGTTATLSIRNNAPGGSGNDWALDDIYMGTCIPSIKLNPIIVPCDNPPTQATATLTDGSHLYDTYQWQVNKADGNGFVNIGNVETGTYAADTLLAIVALPSDLGTNPNTYFGWQYRIVVGTSATDLTSASCSYTTSQRLILQNCGLVLPVKITNITAASVDGKGKVNWQVGEQSNVFMYEVQKSTDGKNYTRLALVDPKQGSVANYEAIDNDLSVGVTYYRVKEVDQNGTMLFSKIVTINNSNNAAANIFIYPNPSSNDLFIQLPSNKKIKNAIILNAIGQQVLATGNLNDVVNHIGISKFAPGLYTLKVITTANEIINTKFIKK